VVMYSALPAIEVEGGVSIVTLMPDEVVEQLEALVTVTVYTPAILAVLLEPVAPLITVLSALHW